MPSFFADRINDPSPEEIKLKHNLTLEKLNRFAGTATGLGDVKSPLVPGSTDNHVVLWDGTSGLQTKNSAIDGAWFNQSVAANASPTFIGVSALNVDFDILTTPPANAEGRLKWNPADGTLDLGMSAGDITLQIGQEQYIRIKNNTGSTILNGKCIYIDDADSGRPTAKLANNKYEVMARKTIGIVTKDIPDGEEGFATTFGKVRGIDTSGYTLGTILYVSDVDGALTNTRPVSGKWIINVGVVTVVDATVGEIFVRSIQYERPDELTLINGFPNTSDTTISVAVALGVGTFTIAPTAPLTEYRYYNQGVQYIKTASESLALTDVEGVHWFYYNGETLTEIVNPNDGQADALIRTSCLVAQVYWDSTNNLAIMVGDERHGFVMSSVTHSYLHFTQGAKWVTGMALNTVNATGDGSADSHAQFGVDSGVSTDEDLARYPSAVASTVGLPIFYIDGASSALRRVTQAGFSVCTDVTAGVGITGRLVYNKLTAGTWSLATVTDNNYVLCHVFNSNDKAQPYIAFIGQNEYSILSSARTAAESEIATIITSFPRQEMVPLATLIFNTKNTFANAVKARVVEVSTGVEYVDWRSTDIVASAVATPTDHNSLSGIQGGAVGERYHLTSAQATSVANGLAGTKVYYVSDTSGGAVTRKLTFVNGLLTSEV